MYDARTAIIDRTAEFVKSKLEGEGSGHDWWHVYRVYKSAINIAKTEPVDIFIVSIAALLHDIADYKFHNGDTEVGPKIARQWLESNVVDQQTIAHVCDIIRNMSFKGAKVQSEMITIEGKVVQDADRLDAIGAIGIGRTFAYGGNKNRTMHDPNIKPAVHETFEQYKANDSTTINHFYEKLLLLKDLMNTNSAKIIAQKRHDFMLSFLEAFYDEWEGKK
jgi:uncharacterized protein